MSNIKNFQECFKVPMCDEYRAKRKVCSVCQEIIDKRISIGAEKQRTQNDQQH